jgi:hypothetical protein
VLIFLRSPHCDLGICPGVAQAWWSPCHRSRPSVHLTNAQLFVSLVFIREHSWNPSGRNISVSELNCDTIVEYRSRNIWRSYLHDREHQPCLSDPRWWQTGVQICPLVYCIFRPMWSSSGASKIAFENCCTSVKECSFKVYSRVWFLLHVVCSYATGCCSTTLCTVLSFRSNVFSGSGLELKHVKYHIVFQFVTIRKINLWEVLQDGEAAKLALFYMCTR